MSRQNKKAIKIINLSFAMLIFLFYRSNTMGYESSPAGWASINDLGCNGTTGGAGGSIITAATEAELIQYATSATPGPLIIQVEGTINLTQRVDISPNKTLIGIGTNPTITGYNLRVRGQNTSGVPLGYNVIVRNLIIKDHSGGDSDGLTITDKAHHIWVDHCTFSNCSDGALDISHACDYITISWNRFYNQDKTSLVGHSDNNGSEDTGHFKITYHHNFFDGTVQRNPRVRFSFLTHVYNNFYNGVADYGVVSACDANVLVEGNYFKNVPFPTLCINYSGTPSGWLIERDNIFENCGTPEVNPPTSMPEPSYYYSYTLDDPEFLPAIVSLGAGVDGVDSFPHWLFTMYGDFDLSGLVDNNDLATFVSYWLDTNDISDINDADYNGDGTVDGLEYASFANNWFNVPSDTTAPQAPAELWAAAGNATVSLDWADNNESDFEGYNIYRSETSGSDYTKLNTTILTNSNYTDNTVINDTMYYYIVTALDTNENESADSVEACAVPNSSTNSVTLQENATGFCHVDGIIDTEEHSGYTGYGYCDTENAAGNGINWSINITSAGSYTFKWRYANGSSDRPARLLINSTEEASGINFSATGSWENWSEVSVIITVNTGIKEIRLEATGSSGLANVDYMMVSGIGPEITPCQ